MQYLEEEMHVFWKNEASKQKNREQRQMREI